MKLYRLEKTVLKLTNQPKSFLNGLTSNDMDQSHNAFLNIHGRIMATFDQLVLNDDEIWIVIASFAVQDVLAHLERYALLSQVDMQEMKHYVYFDVDGDTDCGQDEQRIPCASGNILITLKDLPNQISDQDFCKFRLENNIPMHGIDYHNQMILNVDQDKFVSFTKGCFLGQEPIAKVHNRSQPTWVLVVKYADECSDEEKAKMTSQAEDQNGRCRGFVFVKNK